MAPIRDGLTPAARLQRASRHEKVGDALADAGDEWATVLYFYAAYHLVRSALLSDPVFDDASRLAVYSSRLSKADRFVSRHNGRNPKNGVRVWGVTELVSLLYLPVAADYEALHQASIDVRYKSGLQGVISDAKAALNVIEGAHTAGHLLA